MDAEEIAEPAFVSVQILEEPLPEILEPVPVEPVKKTVRKKSGNTRKKNTANMAEKRKRRRKLLIRRLPEKKSAEEPDELAQAVEKGAFRPDHRPSGGKIHPPVQDQTGNQQCPEQRVQGQ